MQKREEVTALLLENHSRSQLTEARHCFKTSNFMEAKVLFNNQQFYVSANFAHQELVYRESQPSRSDANNSQILVVQIGHDQQAVFSHYLVVGHPQTEVIIIYKKHAQVIPANLVELLQVLFYHNVSDITLGNGRGLFRQINHFNFMPLVGRICPCLFCKIRRGSFAFILTLLLNFVLLSHFHRG